MMRVLRGLVALGLLYAAGPVLAEPVSDPLEPVNRAVFSFNDHLDRFFMKPVAKTYVAVMPTPARVGVSNFFGNFGDIPTAFNNLLQGKVTAALGDVGRVLVNSTVGILGFIDVASEAGLEKHKQDFGLTLGHWGVGAGPYLVLPLLGPSSLRDVAAMPVDYAVGVQRYVFDEVAVRNSLMGLQAVNVRADLLGAEQAMDEASFDNYAFLRNFYMQRRQNLINGDQPAPRKVDDPDDPEAPPRPASTSDGASQQEKKDSP